MPNPYIVANNTFPIGSILNINGVPYTVRDTGGPLMGSRTTINRFDIFTPEGHQVAVNNGLIHDAVIEIVRLGWY